MPRRHSDAGPSSSSVSKWDSKAIQVPSGDQDGALSSKVAERVNRTGAPRGNLTLPLSAFSLLNVGVLSAGLGGALEGAATPVLLGRLGEFLAALLFTAHAWPRVKALGQ